MLRGAGIEFVFRQAFPAGFKREPVPWDYHPEITRFRTDTAIAFRYDECRRCNDFEPDPSAVTTALM